MFCSKCGSKRIMSVNGKCSDMFSAEYNEMGYEGYVLENINIGGDDYIEFDYCLNCGAIQGQFPVGEPQGFVKDED